MQTVRITTSQNIDIDYELAGLGPRIISYFIDSIIVGLTLALILFSSILFGSMVRGGTSMMAVIGLAMLLYLFYDLICETVFNGQSIGKKIMNIKVISIDGSRPSIGQYLLRWVFRIADITLTSGMGAVIAIAVSEKKQRIGDLAAGTAVVRTEPKTQIEHLAFIAPSTHYEVVFPEAGNLSDKEITLIQEVLQNFSESGNYTLLHSMASRIKEHLRIKDSLRHDEQFLQTIVKDYTHLQQAEH